MSTNQAIVKDEAALVVLIEKCLQNNPSVTQRDHSVQVLLPVVALLGQDKYAFAPAESLDMKQIRKVMGPLIDKKSFSLAPVSFSTTKIRFWNGDGAPELSVPFFKALTNNFRGINFSGFGAGPHIVDWGFDGWRRDFEALVNQSCRQHLWTGCVACTDQEGLLVFYRELIHHSLVYPIMLYLTLLSRGDPRARMFEDFLQILPKTIPLGNRLTNKREWLILTA